jgi:hypothetical protein
LLQTQAVLSATTLGLAFADLIITRFLVEKGIASEGNPLIRGHIGDDVFGIIKIAGTLFALLIIADIFRRYPKFTVNVTAVIVLFYTTVVWWNIFLALGGIFR